MTSDQRKRFTVITNHELEHKEKEYHEAEEKYGGGTGEIKFSYVAQKIYDIMPSWLQIFFSAETIAGWIEDAVTAMKEYLSSNEEAATKINYTEKKKLVD